MTLFFPSFNYKKKKTGDAGTEETMSTSDEVG